MKSVPLITLPLLMTLSACPAPEAPIVTRLHLANDSGATLTYFAIADSEYALAHAKNRLTTPIEPDAVYSVLLDHPGNYWVRTEYQDGNGHTIKRIEGPFRIASGISEWAYPRIDAQPLYGATGRVIAAAGRISFSSN